jgi:hypothetical protein
VAKSITPKAAKSAEKTKAKKTKTAVSLTDEAIRRLGAACTAHGLDQSELVEWLIQENLSGYVIQVRGQPIPIGKSYGQTNPSASVMLDESATQAVHVSAPSMVGI